MPKSNAKRAEIAQRRRIVAENIVKGMNYRDIAQDLNVGIATVARDWKAIDEEWRAARIDEVDELMSLRRRQLAILLNQYWDDALAGDVTAAHLVLKITEREDKLVGIERPKRVEVTGKGGGPLQHNQVRTVVILPDNGRGDAPHQLPAPSAGANPAAAMVVEHSAKA